MSNRFISIVPAVRTIPGVEVFDYAVASDADLRVGDLLHVPFRKKQVLALIVGMSATSPVGEKAIFLSTPAVLFRFGDDLVHLLRDAAQRSFSSQPTVLASWIRQFPKRKLATPPSVSSSSQTQLPIRENRFLQQTWQDPRGLISEAAHRSGKTLVLTPWQHRADQLANELHATAIHGDITPRATWNAIAQFATSTDTIIVTTRVGAWLSSIADTVLIDEPENDDLKSDELQPRLDSRWLVLRAAELRPMLSFVSFSTTPRLRASIPADSAVPTIDLRLTREPWKRRSGSAVELLSPQCVIRIEETLELQPEKEVWIIHPIRGERASLTCRDCGWAALCAFCTFKLSQTGRVIHCKRCGRKSTAPDECRSCGGMDFSRGQPGADRLAVQCLQHFGTPNVHVIDPMEFDRRSHLGDTHPSLIVITDFSLLAPGVEDIRRKERLVIAWRRISTQACSLDAAVYLQGHETSLAECADWLTSDGMMRTWDLELRERAAFGYPPAIRMAKLLVDDTADAAESIKKAISSTISNGWSIEGPYPVEHRSTTRTTRFVLLVRTVFGTADDQLIQALNPWKTKALIDLDPIAFFS